MDAFSKNQEYLEKFKMLTDDQRAAIYAGSVGAAQEIRVMTLDLTTAKLDTAPFRVGFAFRSFYVYAATDTAVSINMRLGTMDSFQDKITISRDTQFQLPYAINEAYLDWTAQSGKSITIIFLRTGTFNLNRIQTSQSTASLDGATVTTSAVATVTGTAASLLAASASRIVSTVQNQGSIPIYVGDSGVTGSAGAKPGIKVDSGGSFTYRNTAALFAITDSGSNANIALMTES